MKKYWSVVKDWGHNFPEINQRVMVKEEYRDYSHRHFVARIVDVHINTTLFPASPFYEFTLEWAEGDGWDELVKYKREPFGQWEIEPV